MNVLKRSLSEMKILNYILQKNKSLRLAEVSISLRHLIHYAQPRLSNFHLINIRCENKINNK